MSLRYNRRDTCHNCAIVQPYAGPFSHAPNYLSLWLAASILGVPNGSLGTKDGGLWEASASALRILSGTEQALARGQLFDFETKVQKTSVPEWP